MIKTENVKRHLRLFRNRLRMRWIDGSTKRLRLTLHEKHQQKVTIVIWVLTVVGAVTVFITLTVPWNIIVGLGSILLGVFLQKIKYRYYTLYVQPMPNFIYDPAKWTDVAYGGLDSDLGIYDPWVALVFNDVDYAVGFFELLRSWNFGKSTDRKGNIQLSFIFEENGEYIFGLYPSFKRKPVKKFFTKVSKKEKLKNYGKIRTPTVLSLKIGHRFMVGPNTKMFVDKVQGADASFLLKPELKKNGERYEIKEIAPIRIYKFKAKARGDLSLEDLERDMF